MSQKKIGYQQKPEKKSNIDLSESKSYKVKDIRECIIKALNEDAGMYIVPNTPIKNSADLNKVMNAAETNPIYNDPNVEGIKANVAGSNKTNPGFDIQAQDNTSDANNQKMIDTAQKTGSSVIMPKEGKSYTKKDIMEMRLKNLRSNTKTITKGSLKEMILGRR